MTQQYQEIIQTSFVEELPAYTKRYTEVYLLPKKINVIIGMRRTGKSYFMTQNIETILAQGVDRKRILNISFEDDRFSLMSFQDLRNFFEEYFRMVPVARTEGCYFFLDEIQNIKHWEKVLRTLMDTEKVKIYVTGSSAKLLSKEIATELRGRSLTTEIFPFSFREYLLHKYDKDYLMLEHTSSDRSILENESLQYCMVGGFPEVQKVTAEIRVELHHNYIDVVMLRDIIERHNITSVAALRSITKYIIANPASLFSVHKLHSVLKSMGVGIGKDMLHDLIEHLQDTYVFFSITIYSNSEKVKQINSKKIYVIDSGLALSYLRNFQKHSGFLFENMVFNSLRRKYQNIFYYKTKKGLEVDFLIEAPKEDLLIQSAIYLDQETTIEREKQALEEAMAELKIELGTIVTMHQSLEIQTKHGLIRIIPYWKFCLELN